MVHKSSLFGFDESADPRQRFLPYLLLISVTFVLYADALYFNFVWDDFHYIVENYQIQGLSPRHLRDIWTAPYFSNYAPVHNLALAVVHSFSGLEPFGYHWAQLLLHAGCVCLLFRVLKTMESPRVALLTSLLFAAHPANIETVAWVAETKSTLAFFFFLLSLWFFLRLRERQRWREGVLCGLFLLLSVLSKISTVVAPAIFLLCDYKEGGLREKRRWGSLACFFLIGVIFTGVHLASSSELGRAAPPPRWLIDSALTDIRLPRSLESSGYFGGPYVHFLNLPRFLVFYLRMVVFPHPLSAWHMFRVFGELNGATGAAWIGLLGLLWLLYRSPPNLQFWELWFFVFLAPVLQLIPNLIWVADRYLYIPAIGAFVLWSKLFFHLSGRIGKLRLLLSLEAVMIAILMAFAWQTRTHLPVWRDNVTLWGTTAKGCATSAFCHFELGNSLLQDAQNGRAVRELFQAVRIRPIPVYLIALGDAYSDRLGDYPRALKAYRMAEQYGGVLNVNFLAKVAKTYSLAGDLRQARRVIDAGRKISPDNSYLLMTDGFLQWKEGHREQARRSLRKMLAQNAINPETSHPPRFFNRFWEHPAEVGRLLADLGPL